VSDIVGRRGGVPRGQAEPSGAARFFDLPGTVQVTKRVFDVLAASAILFLCAPLLGVIALLIRVGSRGPALYKQTRVGLGGRRFVMYKFRTMYDGVDATPHRRHVEELILASRRMGPEGGPGAWVDLKDDRRITPAGRMLRRLGLDELPQLLNVLRGDMSLVGPRPALPYEVELYDVWHRQRLAALPGITGFWQVRAGNRVSFDDMVRMDLDYLRRRSLWLDVKLLLQTPWAVLVGRGIQ
jgi:lipopolysaccharide/colanic/teichoic acid biosynthesis glycosyltransferase